MTEKESLTDAVGTSFDLFDALAEAVFLLDDEGRITSANAAAETLIGRTRRALSGVDVAKRPAGFDGVRLPREPLKQHPSCFRRWSFCGGFFRPCGCEPRFRRFRLSL